MSILSQVISLSNLLANNGAANTSPHNACVAEINLKGGTPAVSIPDGQTTTSIANNTFFGETTTGGTVAKVFTIENTICGTLNVGAITFSGANADDFTVTASPASTVGTNSSTNFTVTFSPQGGGLRTATINIVNDDTNENPYNFTLQGVGICATTTSTHNFDNITTNATSFSSGGATFNLTDFMVGFLSNDLGSSSPPSDGYFDSGFGFSRAAGSNLGGIKVAAGKIFNLVSLDVWPSADKGNNVVAPPQTVIVKGYKANAEVYSLELTTYDYGQTPTPTGGKWHRIMLPCAEANTDIDEFRLSFPVGSVCDYIAVDNFVYRNLADVPEGSITVTGISSPALANGTYRLENDGSLMPNYALLPSIGYEPYYISWDADQSLWVIREYAGQILYINLTQSLTPPCTGWELEITSTAYGTPVLTGDCSPTAYVPGADEPPNYGFSAFTRTYVELSNAATMLSEVMEDDNMSGPISLPFDFKFAGVNKNTIYVTSNGWMSFDAPVAVPEDNTAYYLNATPGGAIFPLADDLAGDGMSFAGYEVTGTAPNRIFKIEWRNFRWNFNAQDYGISFQVWLYETSNIIDFVYRQESGEVNSGEAVIGIGNNIFSYLVLADASAMPDTSNSVFHNTIAGRPATNQVYRFSPPGSCISPTVFSMTGGGLYCGATPVVIGLGGSEIGVNYQLQRGGSDVGTAVEGTNAAFSFNAQSMAGTYTVVATRAPGGCTTAMSGNAVVTADATPPGIACPDNITVFTSSDAPGRAGDTGDREPCRDCGGDCLGEAYWDTPTPTDNCTGASIQSVSHASGSGFEKGVTTVTYVATDATSNTASCTFTVTVYDDELPSITCPDNITVNTSGTVNRTEGGAARLGCRGCEGDCLGEASWNTPTPTDNCTGANIQSVSHANGSAFAKGSTTVTYIAADAAGNTASCSFAVTVIDDEAPSITCPSNVTANTSDGGTGDCFGTASWTAPVPTDNCTGAQIQSVSNASGSAFAKGSNTVTYTAADAAGNTASCTFTVTVFDDEAPSITCPMNVTIGTSADRPANYERLHGWATGDAARNSGCLDCPGDCAANATWVAPTPTDNCGNLSTASSHEPGTSFDKGTTVVTYSTTDGATGTSTCSFTITVSDNEPPAAICQNRTVTVNGTADGTLTAATVNDNSEDNCTTSGALVFALDKTTFGCNDIGSQTVTLTVTDEAGNSAICNAAVTVINLTIYSETGRRNASDGLAGDKYGWGIALHGTLAAAGAPDDKVGTQNKQGSAYVLDGNSNWLQIKQIKAADGAAVDYFGNALSLEGTTLLAGAYGDNIGANTDQGSAYIFEQGLGGTNNWGQRKQLFDPSGIAYDYFANAVSLKGDRALIGASRAKIGANTAQGAAYIYQRNSGGTNNWGLVKKLVASDGGGINYFGNSVAQDGSLAIVGANGNSNNRGAAYIFEKDLGGTNNWGQAMKLTASDAAIGDGFGTSVAVAGDDVLVGAPNKATYSGAAYIFNKNEGGAGNWGQVKKIEPSDVAVNDRFGTAVALQGDYAYITSVRGSSGNGAVYIFHRNIGGPNNWGQIAKHSASDGAMLDQFGFSLAVSGEHLAVGANLDDIATKTDQGSLYIFEGENCPENRPAEATSRESASLPGSLLAVNCSPNPFKNFLQISIQSADACALQVTDVVGRVILTRDLPAGETQVEFDGSQLSVGMYFVQVRSEHGTRVVPALLMK